VSENNLFPRKKDIFQKSVRDVQTSVGRPSFDTQFQVVFSFGNYQSWLSEIGGDIPKARTNGLDFKEKMSIMCTEAEFQAHLFKPVLQLVIIKVFKRSFQILELFLLLT